MRYIYILAVLLIPALILSNPLSIEDELNQLLGSLSPIDQISEIINLNPAPDYVIPDLVPPILSGREERAEIPLNEAIILAENYLARYFDFSGNLFSIIPLENLQGKIVAYDLNFSLPERGSVNYAAVYRDWKDYTEANSDRMLGLPGGNDSPFAFVTVAANFDNNPVIASALSLSPFYTMGWRADFTARQKTADPVIERVIYSGALTREIVFSTGQTSLTVSSYPPFRIYDTDTLTVMVLDNEQKYQDKVKDISERYNIDTNLLEQEERDEYLQIYDELMNGNTRYQGLDGTFINYPESFKPLRWTYGCSPTSGGMVAKYWNNRGYGKLSEYFRTGEHVINNGINRHATQAELEISDFMGTNSSGTTNPSEIRIGLRNYFESKDYDAGSSTATGTFLFGSYRWNTITSHINNGRPFVFSYGGINFSDGIGGHSVGCFGYQSSGRRLYIYETWTNVINTISYRADLFTRIDRVNPTNPSQKSEIELTNFQGYNSWGYYSVDFDDIPLYRAYANYEITWASSYFPGSTVSIWYLNESSGFLSEIASGLDNTGSYIWTPDGFNVPLNWPSSFRIVLRLFDNEGDYLASDGSRGRSILSHTPATLTIQSENPAAGIEVFYERVGEDVGFQSDLTEFEIETFVSDNNRYLDVEVPEVIAVGDYREKAFNRWVDNLGFESENAGTAYYVDFDSEFLKAIFHNRVNILSSSPHSGITISCTDNSGVVSEITTPGYIDFPDVTVTIDLTAPEFCPVTNNLFLNWQINDEMFSTSRIMTGLIVDEPLKIVAVYENTRNIFIGSENPASWVPIIVSPADVNGNANGNTTLFRRYHRGSEITLQAPEELQEHVFDNWYINNIPALPSQIYGTTLTYQITDDQHHFLTAKYFNPLATISVSSQNANNVPIYCNEDINSASEGITPFARTYHTGSSVMFIAPWQTANDEWFSHWMKDGVHYSEEHQIVFDLEDDTSLTAVYLGDIMTIEIGSANPDQGVEIILSASDVSGQHNGVTPFTRGYSSGQLLWLTAPQTAAGNFFVHWEKNGLEVAGHPQLPQTLVTTIEDNDIYTAVYSTEAAYCIPEYEIDPVTWYYIDSVIIGDINNTDSGGQDGAVYNDYTSQFATELVRGEEYTISITNGSLDAVRLGAWIDFARNGSFNVEDEIVGEYDVWGGQERSYTFTVPASSVLGNTRLRVRLVAQTGILTGHPCDLATAGEAEDYNVIIVDEPTYTVTDLPFEENFVTGSLPDHWQIASIGDLSPNWILDDGSAYSGNYSLFHDFEYYSMSDNWVILPRIYSENGLRLTFQERNQDMPYYRHHGVWISAGSDDPLHQNFVLWEEFEQGASDWTERNLLIDIEGQNVYIAFRYWGQDGATWSIDGIVIDEMPDFPSPVDLTAHVTGAGIGLDWLAPDMPANDEILYHHNNNPLSGIGQYYGDGYGISFDLSGYPEVILDYLDFYHTADYPEYAPHDFRVHIMDMNAQTLLYSSEVLTTTTDFGWERGVNLPALTMEADVIAVLIEPLGFLGSPFIALDGEGPSFSLQVNLSTMNVGYYPDGYGNHLIELGIRVPVDYIGFAGYNVYRNSMRLNDTVLTDNFYFDEDVQYGASYSYYVTSQYEIRESEPSAAIDCEFSYETEISSLPYHLDFSNPFPPHGWTFENIPGQRRNNKEIRESSGEDERSRFTNNWYLSHTSHAGGELPELGFNWSPQFTGKSYFISPDIDMQEREAIIVSFDYTLLHYSGHYQIGLDVQTENEEWHNVWQQESIHLDITEENVLLYIPKPETLGDIIRLGFYFEGFTMNIQRIYFDDLSILEAPLLLPPANFTGESGDGSVTISWDYPAYDQGLPDDVELIGYNLFRDGDLLNQEPLAGNEYHDVMLNNGQEYEYKILTVYNYGNSPYTEPLIISPEGDHIIYHLPYLQDYSGDFLPAGWSTDQTAYRQGVDEREPSELSKRGRESSRESGNWLWYEQGNLAGGEPPEIGIANFSGQSYLILPRFYKGDINHLHVSFKGFLGVEYADIPFVVSLVVAEIDGGWTELWSVSAESFSGQGDFSVFYNTADHDPDYLRFAFCVDGDTSGSTWFMDDVMIEAIDDIQILQPENVFVYNNLSSIELVWNEPENVLPVTYDIYRNGDLIASVDHPHYFDHDVTAGGEYVYNLRSVHVNYESELSNDALIEFTPVGTVQVPHYQYFDDIDPFSGCYIYELPFESDPDYIPGQNWTIWEADDDQGEGGDYPALMFNQMPLFNGRSVFALPFIDIEGETEILFSYNYFIYLNQNHEIEKLRSVYRYPGSEWNTIESYLDGGSYCIGNAAHLLNGFDEDLVQFGFLFEGISNGFISFHLDEFSITLYDEYPAPHNLVSYPYDNRVTLLWDSPELQFDQQEVPLGYNIYRDNIQINTELLTDRIYIDDQVQNDLPCEYFVKAAYVDQLSEASNIETATPYQPDPITVFPYLEDFDSGLFPPLNWYVYQTGDYNPGWLLEIDADTGINYVKHPFSEEGVLVEDWLVLPAIVTDEPVILSFKELNEIENDPESDDSIVSYHGVWISENSGNPGDGNFFELQVFDESTIDENLGYVWLEREMFIQNNSPEFYIAFKYAGDNGANWHIDDVVIDQFIAFPPSNLTAVTGDNYIELSWSTPVLTRDEGMLNERFSGNVQSGREEIEPLGYNVYRDGVMINNSIVTETYYHDTDVGNTVLYEYYLTALYEYGESSPSNIIHAIPENIVIDVLPFIEDFTGVNTGNIPDGWYRSHYNWRVDNANSAGGETPEMRFDNSYIDNTNFRLITPRIDISNLNELRLSFKHLFVEYPNITDDYVISVQISPDRVDWTPVWSVSTPGNIAQESVALLLDNLDLDNIYISWVFAGSSFNVGLWSIDDIVLEEITHLPWNEDFTGVNEGYIPSGWTRTHNNWRVGEMANWAGGTPPEMIFAWEPQANDLFRLTSPRIVLSDMSDLLLTFKHFINDYSGNLGDFDLSVQMSHDMIEWETVWSVIPDGNLGPETVEILIHGLGQHELYLSWVVSGDSRNIHYWHIDDLTLDKYVTILPWAEDFSGIAPGDIPPRWQRSHDSWGSVNSNSAGGSVPEMRFSETETGLFRLITPQFYLCDPGEIKLSFKHRVHQPASSRDFTLAVQISTDLVEWTTLWSLVSPAPTAGTIEVISGYLDQNEVYLSWVFDGNSSHLNWWAIDDIVLEDYVAPPPVLYPPENLTFEIIDYQSVLLQWEAPLEDNPARNNLRSVSDSNLRPERREILTGTGRNDLPQSVRSNSDQLAQRGLVGYNVYRDGIIINDEITLTTHYTDNDLEYGEIYEYAVTAVYEDGESEPTDTVQPFIEYMITSLPWFEDFTEGNQGDVPFGWRRTHVNWYVNYSQYAGGESPEMVFDWTPESDGLFRMTSPMIDISNASDLQLSFKHHVSHYQGDFDLSVEISNDLVNWSRVWSISPVEDLASETVNIALANLVDDNIYISWVFEGNSYNINFWAVDDISLVYLNDMAAASISGPEIAITGEVAVYTIEVRNMGFNTQDNYTLKLMKEGDLELASVEVTEPLEFLEESSFELIWTPDTEEETYLYGKIVLDNDENLANNTTVIYNVNIMVPISLPYEVDFSGIAIGNIPPGWSSTHNNWSVQDTDQAGGTAPEMQLFWSPSVTGVLRLNSPPIDAAEVPNLSLSFKHFLDDYPQGLYDYTLKLQTSIDGLFWEDLEIIAVRNGDPIDNIGPETYTANLDSLAGEIVYIAWVFEGDTYGIENWNIDDINIYSETVELEAPVVMITVLESSVHLDWEEVDGANSYYIYASGDPYSEDWDLVTQIEFNHYSEIIDPVVGVKFFRVTASNDMIELEFRE